MQRKHLLAAAAGTAMLAAAYLVGDHYLHVRSLGNLTGLSVPFASRLDRHDDGDMTGGRRDIWVRTSAFPDLMAQCRLDGAYAYKVIDYGQYGLRTEPFASKGLGRQPGCIKVVRSGTGGFLVAIDNGYIFINEQSP